MGKVYYVGNYVEDDKTEVYKSAVPARLKMRYVANAITEGGESLTVYSLALSNQRARSVNCRLSENLTVHHIFSFGKKNHLLKKLSEIFRNIQFLFFLLFTVKKEDTVLVYHAYSLLRILQAAHTVKHFFWIAEVEELFAYAWKKPQLLQSEIQRLKSADGYLAVNHQIADYFRDGKKPILISHGAYSAPKAQERHNTDGKIHVLYAGTVETNKKGAFTAVETAQYLSDAYFVHILGFGNDENVQKLNARIDEINREAPVPRVAYHGTRYGQALTDFMFQCDIGLSSNIMEPDFANHTFPSKMITYAAHNLVIVTGYADIFPRCDIASLLHYYYEYDPKAIAQAIMQIDMQTIARNGNALVKDLHRAFVSDLKKIIKQENL